MRDIQTSFLQHTHRITSHHAERIRLLPEQVANQIAAGDRRAPG
jgi:hypothetical protein